MRVLRLSIFLCAAACPAVTSAQPQLAESLLIPRPVAASAAAGQIVDRALQQPRPPLRWGRGPLSPAPGR